MADFRSGAVLEEGPTLQPSDNRAHPGTNTSTPSSLPGFRTPSGFQALEVSRSRTGRRTGGGGHERHGRGRIRPERRNLGAHHNVLKTLMSRSFVPLPMSFGVVGDNPAAVRRLLARNQAAILDQLRRVAGKAEMGLRVKWEVANIFEYFVDTHDELRSLRDRILGGGRMPTHEEKIEIGSSFDRMRTQDRTHFTDAVTSFLSPVCSELKVNKCKDECEVMNLACLVPAERQAAFSRAVFEAARLFDDRYSFDFSGPWAPHNFVSLDLDLGG